MKYFILGECDRIMPNAEETECPEFSFCFECSDEIAREIENLQKEIDSNVERLREILVKLKEYEGD